MQNFSYEKYNLNLLKLSSISLSQDSYNTFKKNMQIIEYLKSTKKKEDEEEEEKDNYSLDNLIPFNNVLKLFNDTYSNKITRETAETTKINASVIYQENAKLIDEFIVLYNKFELNDDEENNLELDKEKNTIIDFFILDDNKYGRSYKKIYKEFINKQNESLESLLNEKIKKKIN